METWKDIPESEGMIEVSNYGNVRSRLGKKVSPLRAQADNKGYLRVRYTVNRVKKTFKVHRAVAKAFLPNPDEKPQVNHIDGNKQNNHIDNLEWVTNSENCRHAIASGLWETVAIGSHRENESRKRKIVATKDGNSKTYNSVAEAERELGTKHISAVLKGKRSHAKGYTFRYAEGR